jgi:hypothetical protein
MIIGRMLDEYVVEFAVCYWGIFISGYSARDNWCLILELVLHLRTQFI